MDCEALTRDVLRRLGDGTDIPDIHRTWQDQEIQDYIRDGYYELCLRTEALWDQWYLDNLPFAANSNFDWEQGFITSKTLSRDFTHTRGIRYGFSNRQFDWERAWAIGSDNPGNHNSPIEWPYLLTDYCTGVVPLPEHMYQVDRATQSGARVHPTRSSELEYVDPLYEETRGAVDAYAQDKDGARVLRKYKLPSSRASAYTALGYGFPRAVVADENEAGLFQMNMDEWAVSDPPALYTILGLSLFSDFVPYLGVASTGSEWTTLPEFTTCTVLGGWGVARRIPNYHPIYGHLGGIRRFHLETNNFKIEGHRRGHRVDDRSSLFEVPDHYLIYVRHYAMAHALSRDSEKQDPDLARHYQARFEAGVARMKERMERMQSQRLRILGESVPQGKIAFAQPPWNLERL